MFAAMKSGLYYVQQDSGRGWQWLSSTETPIYTEALDAYQNLVSYWAEHGSDSLVNRYGRTIRIRLVLCVDERPHVDMSARVIVLEGDLQ